MCAGHDFWKKVKIQKKTWRIDSVQFCTLNEKMWNDCIFSIANFYLFFIPYVLIVFCILSVLII